MRSSRVVVSDQDKGWRYRFSVPSPVKRLRLVTALEVGQDGTVTVPWEVLWALSLNTGDRVAFEREDPDDRVRFCGAGESLRLPLASIGPGGTLSLTELATCRFEPGETLLLWAQSGLGEPWFTLESAGGRRPAPELLVLALYRLEVQPGFKVVLPMDVLWAMSLSEGAEVGFKTSLWALEGWPQAEDRRPAHGRLEIGPGRALPLPEKLWEYPALQPGSHVRFEASVSQARAGFRLEPDLSLETESCGVDG